MQKYKSASTVWNIARSMHCPIIIVFQMRSRFPGHVSHAEGISHISPQTKEDQQTHVRTGRCLCPADTSHAHDGLCMHRTPHCMCTRSHGHHTPRRWRQPIHQLNDQLDAPALEQLRPVLQQQCSRHIRPQAGCLMWHVSLYCP